MILGIDPATRTGIADSGGFRQVWNLVDFAGRDFSLIVEEIEDVPLGRKKPR